MCIIINFIVIPWLINGLVRSSVVLSTLCCIVHSIGCAITGVLHTVVTSLLCKPQYGGKYLGYIMSTEGLSRIIAPLLLPLIYDAWNPLPYLVADGIGVIDLLLVFYFAYITRNCDFLKKTGSKK